MNKTIKDIGERALLDMFEKLVDSGDLPFNDDAVAFSIDDKRSLVVNIDTFVAKTDAPPQMTPYQMGSKSVTMAISDLVAKGIQPLHVVASGAFPENFTVEQTLDLVKGIKETTHSYNAKFLGGDTNAADDIIISVVALGLGQRENLILRSGGQKGDLICTTGKFGLTGAGFKVFLEDFSATKKQKEKFREAIYSPKARLNEGLIFSNFGKITSCIDSSDGLAWCLNELLRNKEKLGIVINELPIDLLVIDFASDNKLKAEELALFGGEEFELVFSLKPENLISLKKEMEVHKIGKFTAEHKGKIMYKFDDVFKEITPKGWEHFT